VAAHADQRVCVGRIGAAHGIRGEVRLQSFTADPLAIADYGPLESEDGKRSFEIESVRPAKTVLVARLKGVTDRDAAEKLCNISLYVPRDRLPAPEADEYYHADLIGLTATTRGGEALGTVVAVHDFGAGDMLELRLTAGGMTVMVPFNEVSVPQVDLAAGRVVVDPPEGTLPDKNPDANKTPDGEE
jgi:16S rRNA processing protein RimM